MSKVIYSLKQQDFSNSSGGSKDQVHARPRNLPIPLIPFLSQEDEGQGQEVDKSHGQGHGESAIRHAGQILLKFSTFMSGKYLVLSDGDRMT